MLFLCVFLKLFRCRFVSLLEPNAQVSFSRKLARVPKVTSKNPRSANAMELVGLFIAAVQLAVHGTFCDSRRQQIYCIFFCPQFIAVQTACSECLAVWTLSAVRSVP